MVAAFILIVHGAAALYAFLKYKKEGVGEGLMAVAFMGIVFAVGWTIATMLTNLLFMPDFFVKWYWQPLESPVWVVVRKEINRDAISLILLTAGEWIFYYFYLKPESGKPATPTSPAP